MKSLIDLMRSASLSKNINQHLGLDNSIVKMLQEQHTLKNQFSSFSMHDALLKSVQHQKSLLDSDFSNALSIAKAITIQPKFNIPATTFDTISAIGLQHEQLFKQLRSLKDFGIPNLGISQINSLQFALGSISGKLTALAASKQKWNLLDDFAELSEQATEISNSISVENIFTKEAGDKLYSLIEQIDTKFDTKDRSFKARALVWLAIFTAIITIHQYFEFLISKSQNVTKDYITTIKKEIIQSIELKLKKENEYRTTNRACKVMLKPNGKSLVIATLNNRFDVIVLQINHKWIYVSYINPTDNLPQTGWVMKKYLSQPK